MKKNNMVVFPIIIQKNKDTPPYFVTIPDLDGYTEGYSISNAIDMAIDYIGTKSLEEQLPKSNYVLPEIKKDETTILVKVNIAEYKKIYNN